MKRIRVVWLSGVAVFLAAAGAYGPAVADYATGLAQYEQGDYAAAAATLAADLAEGPENLDARYLLGLCYHKMGKYEEARSEQAAVIAGRPGHAKAHTNLARALLKLEAYDEAVVEASKGVQLLEDSGAYNVLGLAYLAKKRFEEADAAFAKAIALNPEGAWAYNNRGYALLVKGEEKPREVAAAALELFNKALERSPGHEIFLRNKEYAERVLAE